MKKHYRVQIAQSGKQDIKAMKTYILRQFKYRELAENFSKKVKRALKSLDTFPDGHQHTGFMYRGYQICMKPRDTYLIFYVVDESKQVVTVLMIMQDGMNWQYIIGRWIRES